MKKKSGFTLVEVLAVVVILSILSVIVIPSVFSVTRKARQNSYNILIDSFEENARLYVDRHREEVENSLDTSNSYTLTLNDLKDDNLLKTPINDPITDGEIDLNKIIIITRETDNTFSICFVDRGCYVPTLLVNELTKEGNVVGGTTEGLHYDATNDFYYFRGSNPKNWIEFNGLLWRIVKINTDDSVKIIYEGTKNSSGTNENGNVVSRTFDDVNTNNYNTAVSIRTYLENWYSTNILDANKSKVQSKNWCVGKVSYGVNGTAKGTFLSTECSTQTTSSISVGLITGSEYLYASLDANCLTAYKTSGDYGYTCKNSNYLYKNNYSYWTILGDSTATNIWNVNQTGSLGAPVAANTTSSVRPVINITAGVYIDSGDGTFDKPYKLKDIVNVDKEKPIITMLGESTITVNQGASYTDAGATASDNVNGDLTSKIITISNVNMNVVGTYNITYVVSDNSGNKESAIRTVEVVPAGVPSDYIASEGVNKPKLAAGMIAKKWNGSDWVTVENPDTDTTWYDYANKEWANAQTADGSMWVWIPRYAYQIATNYHTSTAGTINVKFLKENTNTTSDSTQIYEDNASNTHFVKHPAFDFGGTQLTGIWVAKFEMSGTTASLDSKPGIASLRSDIVGNMFTASRNMETNNKYGWTLASGLNTDGTFTTDTNNVDTHMMKNIEWGAVAYLSRSTYGKNAEITINISLDYYTGGDSGTAYVTNVGQSTTGNIYGIYDISGGAYEYVMGNFNNTTGSSGLTPSSINNKYIDRYTAYDSTKYGDAVYETSTSTSGTTSWHGDFSFMINASSPWFICGGNYVDGSMAGAFSFAGSTGGVSSSHSWRSVVLTGEGL